MINRGQVLSFLLLELSVASVGSVIWNSQKFPLRNCHETDIDLVVVAYPSPVSLQDDVTQSHDPLLPSFNFQSLLLDKLLEIFLLPNDTSLERVQVSVLSWTSGGPSVQVGFQDDKTTHELRLKVPFYEEKNITAPSFKNWVTSSLDLALDILSTRGSGRNVSRVVVMGLRATFLSLTDVEYLEIALPSYGSISNINLLTVVFDSENQEHNKKFESFPDTLHLASAFLIPIDQRLGMALCRQCMEGWYGYIYEGTVNEISCHTLFPIGRRSWYNVDSSCKSFSPGSEISCLETKGEIDTLLGALNSSFPDPGEYYIFFFLGLKRDTDTFPQRWRWNNGRPLIFTHWDYHNVRGISASCVEWDWYGPENNGWTDVACGIIWDLEGGMCETSIISFKESLSIPPAAQNNFYKALNSGLFSTLGGTIVSAFLYNTDTESVNTEQMLFICNPADDYKQMIPYSLVCDRVQHCENNGDENFCALRPCVPEEEYQCRPGECIPEAARCDAFKDCEDGADEKDCATECKGQICPNDDRTCFPKHWFFDGENDCPGDEYDHDSRDELLGKCVFTCNRTDCVLPEQLNDGKVDCHGIEGPIDETIGKFFHNTKTSCILHWRGVVNTTIWAPICYYIKDRYEGLLGCRDMHHLHDCKDFECSEGYVKCPNAYCIPVHYVQDGTFDCPFGEDELSVAPTNCTGNFACWNSPMCLHPDLVCDGIPHCPSGDDELDCFTSCHAGFQCILGTVTSTKDANMSGPLQDLSFVDPRTRFLKMSGFDLSSPFNDTTKRGRFLNLYEVYLSGCNIQDALGTFTTDVRLLKTVFRIDMSYNHIKIIPRRSMFSYMENMRHLDLSHNKKLTTIEEEGLFLYDRNSRLESLNLSFTSINFVDHKSFQGLTNLKLLNLSHTLLTILHSKTFPQNFILDTLDIRKNPLKKFDPDALMSLNIRTSLLVDNFFMCCPQVRGENIPEHTCQAPGNAISSCTQLVGHFIHRILLWVVGAIAIFGNISVMLVRFLWDREVLKHSYGIFVTNLSVSDLIMGIYLFAIASADEYFKDQYLWYDKDWRYSKLCTIAGFLSTFSSEVSMFFIFLITLDRLLVIKFPFGTYRITQTGVVISSTLAWLVGFLLALVPSLFSHWDIYSSTAMCLGLPLTSERLNGWEYSTAVFVGLNFVMFILIACGQWVTYRAMSETRSRMSGSVQSSNRRAQDITVAKQLSLVVLSDFLCWFSIGVMGIMAASGRYISNEAYAWSAVLVFPVNAALNPLLYTLPVISARWEKFKKGHTKRPVDTINPKSIPLQMAGQEIIYYVCPKCQKRTSELVVDKGIGADTM